MAKVKKILQCPECTMTFVTKNNYKRHKQRVHTPVNCPDCNKLLPDKKHLKSHRDREHSYFRCLECPGHPTFARKFSFNRHNQVYHQGIFPETICQLCHTSLANEDAANEHFSDYHGQNSEWEMYDHALKKSVQNWRTTLRLASGIEVLLSETYLNKIVEFLKKHRAQHPHFRVSFCVIVIWAASATESLSALKQIPIRTYSRSVMLGTNLRQFAISMIEELMERIENFEHNGSGYVLQEIMTLDLEIFNFAALRAGCADINLREIQNSSHLLSVENKDDYCLLYRYPGRVITTA